MKLVSFTCPGCAARLDIDAEKEWATCSYCSQRFPIIHEARADESVNTHKGDKDSEMRRQYGIDEPSENNRLEPLSAQKNGSEWMLGFIPLLLSLLGMQSKNILRSVFYVFGAAVLLIILITALTSGAIPNLGEMFGLGRG